uniref:Caudal type homeobox 2 n=1 Tax=Laticauda laticaudata TaxID=8630 RepID=A0A8C5WSV9_LATLA
MYVSYLLEKESPSMYPGSVRHAGGLNLSAAQNFVGAPQYPDYGAYHVPAGGPGTAPAAALHGPSPAALAYSPAGDYLPHPHHPSQGPPAPPCGVPPSAGLMQPLNPPLGSDPLSPAGQRRNFCDWMRKPTAGGPGKAERVGMKTRTKDKYRVVYTDHQRLELEKEFHYSRYITIRRKAELAATLGLSERQVKIWFQNRRAKERKINKKKLQQSQPGSEPLSPVSSMQAGTPGSVPSGGVLGATGLTPTVEEKKNH